tara:strand:- start:80 stop:331 length:252 start_codon:yes stop_codon:yes gene_type:complete
MAKKDKGKLADIIPFPLNSGKSRPVSPDARINKLKARMAEVETEGMMIQDDIRWLNARLEESKQEFREIIAELSKLGDIYEDS